ncbi:MAG: hypothetical protein ACOCQX_02035 [Candidatus Nanoarchaeia archaeon]
MKWANILFLSVLLVALVGCDAVEITGEAVASAREVNNGLCNDIDEKKACDRVFSCKYIEKNNQSNCVTK